MPVTFCGTLVGPTKKPVLGRQSYNEAIKKLVPHIAEARKNGRYGTQEIADYLNEKGIKAPSGRSFTYTTLYRAINRLWKMRLTDATRAVSDAASARPSRSVLASPCIPTR
jgi:Recombinase